MKKKVSGKERVKKYATGTAADGVGGYGSLISSIPGIADGIISLFENNPNAYSRQPIMDASTIRGMSTPYSQFAYGTDMEGVEGGEKNKKTPVPLSTTDYTNWNNVVKYARKKKLDPAALDHDPNIGLGVIDEYNKANPTAVFDRNRVTDVQTLMQNYRAAAIERMKKVTPEAQKATGFYPTKQFGDDFNGFMGGISKIDGFPGSKTLDWEIPEEYMTVKTPEKVTTARVGFAPQTTFAYGGTIGEEDQMGQLQALADEQGISIEELMAQLQSAQDPNTLDDGQDDFSTDENDYPMEEDDTDYEDDGEEEEGETFAKGGRVRGMYALGSRGVPVEVEGNEVLETPGRNVYQAKGPSHEDGGVKVNVPPGTKIFSDRVKVDGKTMQERKLSREKALKKLQALKLKNPYDKLLQNTLQRTMQNHQAEEAEDMQLQETMKRIENPSKFPTGTGPNGVPRPRLRGISQAIMDTYGIPNSSPLNMDLPQESLFDSPNTIDPIGMQTNTNPVAFQNTPSRFTAASPTPTVETPDGSPFTAGDYVGMAGNLFNAIAPLINTRNAAKATKPTINRYRGFGHEAIEGNDRAQNMAATMQDEALTDISTADNTIKARNRNSAQSVNTLRALDAVTDLGTNKARTGARDAFVRQILGLSSQRGQLTNMRDRMEMSGQERADIENDAKTDNYFSNNAANLVNFGSNIQGIGKNLNTANQNQVDAGLISSMTKNPIKVTSSGKIVNRNMSEQDVQALLDLGYTIENGKLVRPRKRG